MIMIMIMMIFMIFMIIFILTLGFAFFHNRAHIDSSFQLKWPRLLLVIIIIMNMF